MHGNGSKKSRAFWARESIILAAALGLGLTAAAAGGSALAAPAETVLHTFGGTGDGAA
jgi:hypothetical protein